MSTDDRLLSYYVFNDSTGWDIGFINLDGEPAIESVLEMEGMQMDVRLSHDDRFFAYTSNETGLTEVFVEPYPPTGTKWQVSRGGGEEPLWAPDGTALYYVNGPETMVVDIETRPDFTPRIPRLLYEGPYLQLDGFNWEIMPDGQSFIMVRGSDELTTTHLNLIINWFEELNRLLPPSE